MKQLLRGSWMMLACLLVMVSLATAATQSKSRLNLYVTPDSALGQISNVCFYVSKDGAPATRIGSCDAIPDSSGQYSRSWTISKIPGEYVFTGIINRVSGTPVTVEILRYRVGTPPPPTPAPTADLKVNGSDQAVTVNSGATVTLAWTSTNATACTLGPGTFPTTPTGTATSPALTQSVTFTLTCTGAGGSATDSVDVTVQAVPPTPTPTVTSQVTGDPASGQPYAWEAIVAGTTADIMVRFLVDGVERRVEHAAPYCGSTEGPPSCVADLRLGPGQHILKVELYAEGGTTVLASDSKTITEGIPVGAFWGRYWQIPPSPAIPTGTPTTAPFAQRLDPAPLAFDWGNTEPVAGIGDTFFAEWQGRFNIATAGAYEFTITTDDGFRLFVDGVKVFEKWFGQSPTTYKHQHWMPAGLRTIRVEFFDFAGGATAKMSWVDIPEFILTGNGASGSITIAPGGNVTLVWETVGAQSVLIMPGNFTALNGTATVTPAATTTYTITVTFPDGSVQTGTLLVTVSTVTASCIEPTYPTGDNPAGPGLLRYYPRRHYTLGKPNCTAPNALAFQQVEVGKTHPGTVLLLQMLPGTTASQITATATGPYRALPTVARGAGWEIPVEYAPTTPGTAQQGTLTIQTPQGSLSQPLRGDAVAVGTPRVRLDCWGGGCIVYPEAMPTTLPSDYVVMTSPSGAAGKAGAARCWVRKAGGNYAFVSSNPDSNFTTACWQYLNPVAQGQDSYGTVPTGTWPAWLEVRGLIHFATKPKATGDILEPLQDGTFEVRWYTSGGTLRGRSSAFTVPAGIRWTAPAPVTRTGPVPLPPPMTEAQQREWREMERLEQEAEAKAERLLFRPGL